MNEEDTVQLEEELAGARAQLEAFQSTVADREAKALHLESLLANLRQELSIAKQVVERRDEELSTLRTRAEELQETVRGSAERYRALVLDRSPELPAELVAGATVDEIDLAVERARETVSKVRGHLEAQAQSARVPIGAPVRSGADSFGLSAEQKIARGIEQRRSA